MLITLVAVAFFIGAIAFVKYRQIQTAMAQGMAYQPPPEAVTSTVARTEQWPATLSSIGIVQAVQGVTVSADLAGVVQKINFESGAPVRQGQVLIALDTSQEEAQRAAAEAQRDLARVKFQRVQALHQQNVLADADLDQSTAELKQAEANVSEIEATIARKTIRAPFSGVLGIRQVDLGQYLKSGDPIVPLQALDPVYVNFSVPQQQVYALHPGGEVRVDSEEMSGFTAAGRVTAVNSVADEATRNVQVQATIRNPDRALRPGMFLQVQAVLGDATPVIALPSSAVAHAPYGDSVFIIQQMQGKDGRSYRGVRQQFVKLGNERGDQVAIVSGVKEGDEVATSGVFKLRNGAAVVVNNQVQPSNNPAPKPEDS
jgi:membrane fusion protein, multidrug efflux system